MRVVGVVAEAVVLLFGIVEHQAELHALPGQLAVGQAPHSGDDGREPLLEIAADQVGPSLTVGGPLIRHPGQIVDEQIGGGLEIGRAAIAIAPRAVRGVEIAGRPIAGAGAGAVQILSPEQELHGVVPRGDVRFDLVHFMQRVGQQLLRDVPGVDHAARYLQRGVRDDVDPIVRVLVGLAAVTRRDVVYKPLVEGPGVHLAFPIVDDGVSEAVDLGLLVGHARCPPGVSGHGEIFFRGFDDKAVDRPLQIAGSTQRILVHGVCDVRVVRQHFAFLWRGKRLRRKGQQGNRGQQRLHGPHLLNAS